MDHQRTCAECAKASLLRVRLLPVERRAQVRAPGEARDAGLLGSPELPLGVVVVDVAAGKQDRLSDHRSASPSRWQARIRPRSTQSRTMGSASKQAQTTGHSSARSRPSLAAASSTLPTSTGHREGTNACPSMRGHATARSPRRLRRERPTPGASPPRRRSQCQLKTAHFEVAGARQVAHTSPTTKSRPSRLTWNMRTGGASTGLASRSGMLFGDADPDCSVPEPGFQGSRAAVSGPLTRHGYRLPCRCGLPNGVLCVPRSDRATLARWARQAVRCRRPPSVAPPDQGSSGSR